MHRISKLLGLGVAMMCLGGTVMATIMPSQPDFVTSLNGKWRFRLEQSKPTAKPPARRPDQSVTDVPQTFEPFFKTDYKEDSNWHDFMVPGDWEMAGYSPATYWQPDDASGQFRRQFTVPASWKGRVVRINFDGVQNGAEVWVNGKPVSVTESSWGRDNYHESGWTAWQADITPAVKFGETNLLAIRVTKKTQSSNLDSGDYYFLGGVYRPVTLFSVPKAHICDLTVQTRLLPDNKAEVKVIAAVSGDQSAVSMQIEGLAPMQAAVANGVAELTQIVLKPRLWSAEHPNLYSLDVDLKDSAGKTTEQIHRRVGIREVTIKDGILLVNGVPVKLTGICRHDVSAEDGTAVGEKLWRKDLTLMKAANINAIRTSHYPYGSGFYDLCDEMGFYVMDELPYCWCPTDTDELTPAYTQRARETVARDKNHASIIVWAIGNENKAGKNLRIVADLVRQLDSTRPRLVSCLRADENNVEFDDSHYTAPERMQKAADDKERRAKWPMIYLENPNVWDVRFGADYGCLDIWAEVMRRTWDVAWASDGIPGSFLWEWQDRAVADKCPTKLYQFDPVTGINYVKTKGLVDAYRNPRADYYHVKMVYAPIKVSPTIDLKSKPGFAVLDVTNRYSFTDLSELEVNWQVLKSGKSIQSGKASVNLAPLTSGKIDLTLPKAAGDTLRLDFNDPRGWNVVTYQFPLAPKAEPNRMLAALPDSLGFPRLNLVAKFTENDPDTFKRAYRWQGKLTNVKTDPAGAQLLSDVRSLDADIVLTDETIVPDLAGKKRDPKVVTPDPNAVVARVHAEFANGKFSYTIDWTGPKTDIEQVGWAFSMPKAFDRFSWDRKALWSYYPETHIGRPVGTALPDSANVHITKITRPDAFDFVSTKYNCNSATLTDSKGGGLRVEFASDSREHVRGGIAAGGYELIVNKQCSPPQDISSTVVPDLYLQLSSGDHVEGSFRVGSNKAN
jgi:beta-galactosidase